MAHNHFHLSTHPPNKRSQTPDYFMVFMILVFSHSTNTHNRLWMCVCVRKERQRERGIEQGYMDIMHYFCHNDLETKMRNNEICPPVINEGVVLETQQICLNSFIFSCELWNQVIVDSCWFSLTRVVCLFPAICMAVTFVEVSFSCVAGFLLKDVPDSPQTVSLNVVAIYSRISMQPTGHLARLHVWLRDAVLL